MAENDPDKLVQKICELCKENSSKYCCPRCSILYCSLDCYKSQNHAECSEGFYRDSVHEELASCHVDDESKQKMIDILKQMQDEGAAGGDGFDLLDDTEDINNDSDDEVVLDIHDRIKCLDLEDADALWDALTVDERNDFRSIVNHGEIGGLMPDWEPWWVCKKMNRRPGKVSEEIQKFHRCPVHKEVPEFSALTTVEPSKAIRYNITNVIASYAFTLRYFYGEVDAVEWAIHFLNVCDNLDKNTNFEEPALAVESVVQNCLQSQIIKTDKESLDVMRKDTFLILQGPDEDHPNHYCKSVLSHVHRILSHANVLAKKPIICPKPNDKEKEFSKIFQDHKVKYMVKLDRDKVKKCLKKVEYYLSYVNSYSMEYDLDEEL